MNVELTIQHMFDNFPILFKERVDCLDHLFCTIGNGYEWKNGELVDPFFKTSKTNVQALKSHLVDGKAFQHNKMSLRDEMVYVAREYGEDASPSDPKYQRYPDDQYHKEPRALRWYFITLKKMGFADGPNFSEKFAYLFNYPKDIKPDWKLAIEECRQMIIEDGYEIPHFPNKMQK